MTPVLIAAAGFVLYTIALYPAALLLIARRRPRPIQRAKFETTVTVLLPVRNGEAFLRRKLESLAALDYPQELVEVLVLSDGSTDETDEIARSFPAPNVRLLRLPPAGKATALNAGLASAQGEILFLTDVRQPLERQSLRLLVECLADPAVGAASGEIVILDGATQAEADLGLYRRYEQAIRRALSDIDSVPGATGAIYALRRDLARPLPPDTLLDDVYLPLAAFFAGYRVVLEPRARAFDFPTSLHTEFGRKVRTLAGVWQILRLYPQLLTGKNRMLWHFVSHKLFRLLLPHALLTALFVSFVVPEPLRSVSLAGQALFYLTALADLAIPQHFALKRFTSPVRTFIVLMTATFCAAAILVVPARLLWKPTAVRPAARAAS
ncbi:MAG: glycosyltransferase family 2 protein [Bryobacteraceae bacterium]|nr:glycosyltransferase family 2 protein [Bryobacteraceae bacterium]